MQKPDLWVDNDAHLLHFCGHIFPCDRDIEAVLPWKRHALLLSSDTDCLSLWDSEGLVRTARAGVYPQSMAIKEDTAYVCGGSDGRLHLLTLPSLQHSAEYLLPGMPERMCILNKHAYVLSLLPEPEVRTILLHVDLLTGQYQMSGQYNGLPGAVTADDTGLWIGISELIMHLPIGFDAPDIVIEGIGLARKLRKTPDGLIAEDALTDREYHFHIRKERPPYDERPCV